MMKYLGDMTEKEKYDLAYKHYTESRAANGHTSGNVSLVAYKRVMPLPQVEALLIMYGYAQ